MKWNELADKYPSLNIPRDDKGNVIAEAPALSREPKVGDTYEWTKYCVSAGGQGYKKGSRLTLVEQTGMTPWGVISSRGYNWIVKSNPIDSDEYVSVWSGIEQCIDNGYLKLVE